MCVDSSGTVDLIMLLMRGNATFSARSDNLVSGFRFPKSSSQEALLVWYNIQLQPLAASVAVRGGLPLAILPCRAGRGADCKAPRRVENRNSLHTGSGLPN